MRDPHDIRHGDTWEVRNGRAVVVASNDWTPPSPTTPHDQETGTQRITGAER